MNFKKKLASKNLASMTLLIAFSFCLALLSRDGQARSKSPKISFHRHSVDFGRVRQGQILKHRFHFVNSGRGLLKILGTHSACGCTSITMGEKGSFAPGTKGSIDVSFNTKDFVGATSKIVTVMTNEALSPHRTLSLLAEIEADYMVDRPILDFGKVSADRPTTSSLRILPVGNFALAPPKIMLNSDFFSVKQSPLAEGFKLDVTLIGPQKPGILHETLSIHTNSQSKPRFDVHLTAEIKGSITYEPSYLEFGSIDKKSKSKRLIQFTSEAPVEIKTTQLDLNLNGQKVVNANKFIEWSWHKTSKTKYELVLSLLHGQEASGSINGQLAFLTNTKSQEKITIDFYGFFR